MNYDLISPNYKYDQLALNIKGRQEEHWHYNFDKLNFEFLLAGELDSAFRTIIEQRLTSTVAEMNKVEAIYNALVAQIDDPEAYAAAVVRLGA